jgi:hypothetical protein
VGSDYFIKNNGETKNLYKEGLDYSKSLIQYEKTGNKDEIESFCGSNNIHKYDMDYGTKLIARLDSYAREDLFGGYIGKALSSLLFNLSCFIQAKELLSIKDDPQSIISFRNNTYSRAVNEVSKLIMIHCASRSLIEFQNIGIKVSLTPKSEEQRIILNRIWYGHMKKELDWQVTFLSGLLAE